MAKILSRALGAVAVAGIATLALAGPAITDPRPSGLVGENVQGLGVLSQNLNTRDGKAQTGHSENTSNHALTNSLESQTVKVIPDIPLLGNSTIS
ncbi:hypothetical protein ACGFYU_05845 [Streptomyces sp. NPDC048337]|uniref:hypothetical protein n=1 Tax=Streptomyces sp. NPDC048337 TaxID=3365535 RepID=UPI0037148717